jgi:adenosylmethionine-8-amino-7-oxononanoate aminotransferase
MSATGLPAYRELFGPLAPDFLHVPALDPDALEAKILEEGPDTVAAFIAEPVQGAGGVVVPAPDYFPRVREICRRHGILFIADEVICGFGRTGRMFGVEHWNVVPDLMVVAKGITSGYVPLGAVILSEARYKEILDHIGNRVFFHGFTYNAHPTACAVALRNIEIIERERLVERAAGMGRLLLDELAPLRDHQLVGDVRGLGLLVGVALCQDKVTRQPFPPELTVGRRVQQAALERGLFCRALIGDIIALAPPLIVDDGQVRSIAAILQESLRVVERTL